MDITSLPSIPNLPNVPGVPSAIGSKPNQSCLGSMLNALIDTTFSSMKNQNLKYASSLFGTAISFLTNQCAKDNTQALMGLANSPDPKDRLSMCQTQKTSNNVLDTIMKSPLGQLGSDYVDQEIQRAVGVGMDALLASSAVTDVKKYLGKAEDAVFNVIAMAAALQGDIAIGLILSVAKNLLDYLQKKQALLNNLHDVVVQLNNSINVLVSKPYQEALMTNLDEAWSDLVDARNKFVTLRNSVYLNLGFNQHSFSVAKTDISDAIALISPEAATNDTMLPVIGSATIVQKIFGVNPSTAAQFTAISGVWKSSNKLSSYLANYSYYTDRINFMLNNYKNAIDTLTRALNNEALAAMTGFYTQVLDGAVSKIDDITGPMYVAITNPDRNIAANTVSGELFGWTVDLQVLLEFLQAIKPESFFGATNPSAEETAYLLSVTEINAITNKSKLGGMVVLKCAGGIEDATELLAGMTTMIAQAKLAIVGGNVANNIVTISQVLVARVELAQQLCNELIADITPFIASAGMPRSVTAIQNLLQQFGWDRASDILKSGSFTEFFKLNSTTASFVGAAMTCISDASQCVKDDQTAIGLTQMRLNLMQDDQNRRLENARSVNAGRAALKTQLLANLSNCAQLQGQANQLSKNIDCSQTPISQPGGQPPQDNTTISDIVAANTYDNNLVSAAAVGQPISVDDAGTNVTISDLSQDTDVAAQMLMIAQDNYNKDPSSINYQDLQARKEYSTACIAQEDSAIAAKLAVEQDTGLSTNYGDIVTIGRDIAGNGYISFVTRKGVKVYQNSKYSWSNVAYNARLAGTQ